MNVSIDFDMINYIEKLYKIMYSNMVLLSRNYEKDVQYYKKFFLKTWSDQHTVILNNKNVA